MKPEIQQVVAYTAADFRAWLRKNHKKETRVQVVLHKRHTGKDAPTHRELIDEAICFGWIDTTIKRIDEDTYLRNFAKRNDKSTWSDNTLRYAKELIKKKRMTKAGLAAYEKGKVKPTHDTGIPKNPPMPAELKEALKKDKVAEKNFIAFPPSSKKMLYRWYLSAKRDETKKKRIAVIIKAAKENKKNPFNATQ